MPVATQLLTAAGPALGRDVILGVESPSQCQYGLKLCSATHGTQPEHFKDVAGSKNFWTCSVRYPFASYLPSQTFPKVDSELLGYTILDAMGAGFGC